MSVTIDGVKGYEYQYKVTVLIALITKADNVELYVEKEGSEDALLLIETNGIKFKVEIQVKRESNLIDITKLVNWLCHFQEKKSDNNLFQKLIDNNDNNQSIALFVTHSRCSDSLLHLKTDFLSFEKHHTISFTQEFYNKFRQTLKDIKFGSSVLKNNRENFCKTQADTLKSKTELNRILEQCLILEEFTDEKVDNNITSVLNSKYSIAQSRTGDVYLQLLEIVKEGRNNGKDISKRITNHLQSVRIGTPTVDSQYKVRKEENLLIDELTKNGVLFLTGISQCGKTELAKTIASHFVKKGYDYQIHDDISDLKRFLNSNISDNKVAILEDPFGHISLNTNYSEILHKIKDLIGNKEKHHLVIVSSKIELLSEIFDSSKISDYNIKGYHWHDLTIKDKEQIDSFWKLIAIQKSLPNEIIRVVSNGILSSENQDILQIGQLMYLVNEETNQLTNREYNELEHIARRNSVEIAEDIKAKNRIAARILAVCSICSTPIHKLEFQDLAYILSDKEDLLSIRNEEGFTSSYRNDKTPQFPKYSNDVVLTEEDINAIDYLEERGLITLSSNALLITHPNYYEAGRNLFFERSSLQQKTKLEQFKRSIACLNPITSLLAAKNSSFIYNKIKDEYKNTIAQIGFIGLNSIFPAVEDNCLIFLTKFMQELEKEQFEELVDTIQDGGTSSYHIYWHENIPFISSRGGFSNLFIKEHDEASIKRAEDSILRGIKPNLHDAWIYVNGLRRGQQVSQKDFRLLLQFSEGFVRQKIVYKAFLYPEIIDRKFIEELFEDEHPSVVFSTIRASLLYWFSLSDSLQLLIKELSIKSFSKKDIAIRTFRLISTFSIDYSDEAVFQRDFDEEQKKIMWQVWGELFPACVENVPLEVHINSSRFGTTMRDSIKYLDVCVGINVLNAWHKRIDYQIKNGKILDEFEMSIADNLMQITLSDSNSRKELFLQLIEYNDTNFILSNLKWIIEYWGILESYEKNKIIALINSDRIDVRWIKAVLLNSDSPPKEIIMEIFGDSNLFEKDIVEILKAFPDDLLKDCLNVYCGFPQPLWWLAVHHHNDKFWIRIIMYVLLDEYHVGFDICLQEFVSDGVNGFSVFRDDGESFWDNVCSAVKNKDVLTLSLIYNMVNCSCNLYYTKKMWSSLIESYKDDSKVEDLIKCIQENIELILYGNKEDFIEVIDRQFLKEKIIPAISSLELTDEKIEMVGKKRKEEMEMIFNYKLDNWIGEN
ncbi:hypothetical protein VB796_23120 [Arcicella sp. LKC2W]|uniref:nSTAND3 domain-containing NTPase n=1 Tax=Arcicella sp. LKC2W TaxID=2984198 RepID=UPI002B1EEBFA|nr:hypothetical protein [Arcicella sp. LKC2W]MEA5461981.1 hypothetical protein [Arcicella sp. LKC2W]